MSGIPDVVTGEGAKECVMELALKSCHDRVGVARTGRAMLPRAARCRMRRSQLNQPFSGVLPELPAGDGADDAAPRRMPFGRIGHDAATAQPTAVAAVARGHVRVNPGHDARAMGERDVSCRPPERLPLAFDLGAAVAAVEVVVDEAHRLHEGVDRRRADEGPAALLQVLRQRRRFRRGRHRRQRRPVELLRSRFRIGLVAPEIGGERALARRSARSARLALLMVDSILPRWRTMPASLSSRVTSRAPNLATLLDVEAGEGAAEVLALPQDRQPRQAGLKAFEADLLEQARVVGDRPAPFAVVVGGVLGRARAPEAAALAVLADDQSVLRRS